MLLRKPGASDASDALTPPDAPNAPDAPTLPRDDPAGFDEFLAELDEDEAL
jgi:hypothetical protein